MGHSGVALVERRGGDIPPICFGITKFLNKAFFFGDLKVPYAIAKLRLMKRAVLVPLRAYKGLVDQRENCL